jgi:hypothetical protein
MVLEHARGRGRLRRARPVISAYRPGMIWGMRKRARQEPAPTQRS